MNANQHNETFDALGAKQVTREAADRVKAIAARIGRAAKVIALTLVDLSLLDVANLVITHWRRIWPALLWFSGSALAVYSLPIFCLVGGIVLFGLMSYLLAMTILDD